MTWTLPIAMAIAGLLLVLVVSYRQVIAVHPQNGAAARLQIRNRIAAHR